MDDKNMKSTENYLDNLLNSMNGRPSESDDAADTPSKTDTSSQDDFLRKFEKELEDADITPDTVSPMLLPDYTRKVND